MIVQKEDINLVGLALKIYLICQKWKSINPRVLETKLIEIMKNHINYRKFLEICQSIKIKIVFNLFSLKFKCLKIKKITTLSSQILKIIQKTILKINHQDQFSKK